MTSTRELHLSSSLEDYLEAIYHIVQDKQAARAKDIGERMNVNRSSVTGALHALADRQLINYAPYDLITLTERGLIIASKVVHRHELLTGFLIDILSIDREEANEAACRMEHTIRGTIVNRLGYLASFLQTRPPANGKTWLEQFQEYCRQCEELADNEEPPSPM